MFTTLSANRGDSKAAPADSFASAQFLSQLLQQITQPFAVSDNSGRFLLWNRAFEELTGYSEAELHDQDSAGLFAIEGANAEVASPRPLAGQPQPVVAQIRAKGNQVVPVELRTVELNTPDGKPVLMTLAVNLSERQRLEGELRQSQKMEAIGKLAGGVAHDFNNVLTTILGLSESMLSGRTAPTSESLREIHHAATHAAELTHSLLAFSRRQILQMKTIRLDSVIDNIVKMVSRLIGEDIHLQISVAPDLPPIRADQYQLEQVLLNLCLNSRDAMPKGGELRIDARTAVLNEEWCNRNKGSRPGNYVVLSVRDTGEGMDDETLSRVFEPFFTRKALGKGTGLGLSLVYGIVKQHEGFIQVTSELGKGAEFSIYFPSSSGVPEPAQVKESAASAIGSPSVLVVEDEKSVRKLVVEVLSNLGYRTFAAANGEEAVKVFERWSDQIDLVLLDAVIPKKGAMEVYEEIRARKPSVRFLFTSGYNEVFINKKFELDPSFDFLRKPFTTLELATRIRNALA